jgi:hypothetical protein
VKKRGQNPIERAGAALDAARRALRAAGRRPARTPECSDVEELRAARVAGLSDLARRFAGLSAALRGPGLPGVMGHEGELADRLWDLADRVWGMIASVRALAGVALCGDRSDRAFAAALLDAAGSLGEAGRAIVEHLIEAVGER